MTKEETDRSELRWQRGEMESPILCWVAPPDSELMARYIELGY
jgi:hypothetical protein